MIEYKIIERNSNSYFKEEIRVDCPCCDYYTTAGMGDYDIEGYKWDCYKSFMCHLRAKIRLSGCPKHILFLIEVLGKEKALVELEVMSKKNIIIGIHLKKIVAKLKKEQSP